MAGNWSRRVSGLIAVAAVAAAGCGSVAGGPGSAGTSARGGSVPPGVMPAVQACKRVTGLSPKGDLRGVERVHLVLTTYAKGEPAGSDGDISRGMPARTLVWVVDVHAKAVSMVYSPPLGAKPPGPADSYSVVMNTRTGLITDDGEGPSWPLPLWKVGTVISLPPRC